MPIANVHEFEAVISKAIVKLDKFLQDKEIAKVKDARRDLEKILKIARDKNQVKAMSARLNQISEIVRVDVGDEAMLNDVWDLMDFVDYRL